MATAVRLSGPSKGRTVPREREQKPNRNKTDGLAMLYVESLLKKRGVSVDILANEAGIHRATIFRWLRGESSPTLAQLDALAKALGFDTAWDLKPPKNFKG
jgi:ribosome-binding protein aMBF1 (putative translation factor)